MATTPFKVKSVFEYTSEHDDDLNFPMGQVITVTELEGDDWYIGEYTDVTGGKHEGLFPSNFVEKYEPEVPTRPTRPTRPKQEVQQPTAAPSAIEDVSPPPPSRSKPSAPPIDATVPPSSAGEPRSPPSASTQRQPSTSMDTPAAAEPIEGTTASKKPPPPVAAKSNAFKDRIAAFNQPAAAPVTPMQVGGKPAPSSGFIKKPFVAPPPSKSAYVPAPKVDPIHKPYLRDEDPEIRQRQEEDRNAAEAAGMSHESSTAAQGEQEEDAPKPMTLKERMALLQKQQQEQAQRRADSSQQKKEKKMPQKQASESSDRGAVPEAETETLEHGKSDATERQSFDAPRRRPTEPRSPVPASAEHEVLSGHEADQSGAGEMSEDDDETGTLGPEDGDERQAESLRQSVPPRAEADVGDEEDTTEGDEGEEEEVDEETRRKEELRARMARLGGGGMPGMGGPFNPFGAPPPAPARRTQTSRDQQADEDVPSQQRVAMVPVPGMQRMQSPESDPTERVPRRDEEADESGEEAAPPPPIHTSTMERGAAPPVPKDSRPVPAAPQERAVPPPPPRQSTEPRPVPPPPPPSAAPMSPGPGSESDDEMSSHAKSTSADASGVEIPLPVRSRAPVPPTRELPPRPPQSPGVKRVSQYDSSDPSSNTSDKRSSRIPPPVPVGSTPTSPRPPPPPPPSAMQLAMDTHEDERVGSDYDGDYDTDIVSSAKHKDALKAPHNRESSLTDSTLADESSLSSPIIAPQAPAPRAVPPPPPEAFPKTRQSMDRAPPPVPSRDVAEDDPGYDPYRYNEGSRAVPPVPSSVPVGAPPPPPPHESQQAEESSEDELYTSRTPPRRSTDRALPPPPQERAVPAPPSQERAIPPSSSQGAPAMLAPTRASTDIQRSQTTARRSMEQNRPSGEHGQIASELALPTSPSWWTADQPLPPALQSRNGIDVLTESEETFKSKRGGRKEITKDIYILYMDYSQTVISVRFDSQDPAEVHFEQRHEPPPQKLRQDQLEGAWQRFGTKIADAASQVGHSKKDSNVGDGSPSNLPFELIKAQRDALLPVGTRSYGALVYANLANASTMQFDEIRRGDIVTVRNARFEGHHGAMKTKYKTDYGTSHVAVVEEWDGTRRAVRAWEQGREKKGGVRSEKFRLGDLRSGEVRVWRVVGRDWVGWES